MSDVRSRQQAEATVVLGLAQQFGRPDFDALVDEILAANVRFQNIDLRDAFLGIISAMRIIRKVPANISRADIVAAVRQMAQHPPDALRVALSEGCWHLVRHRLEAVCGRPILATQQTDLDTQGVIRWQHKLCPDCCREAGIVNGHHGG